MHNRLNQNAYIDDDWLALENTDLFSKTWQFAGLETDFKSNGDYQALELGAFQIVVILQKTGELRAFHNLCRHRGTTLLEGSGNTGNSIVCPYHRWTYVSDGRLKGVPKMDSCFPDLDRKSLSLKPASVGVFKGLVFINPDPAADFEAFITPIQNKAWPHDLSGKDVTELPPLHYALKCNWKVFIENAIDGYHLAYLHENTLGGPVVEENIWEHHDDHMIWYAVDQQDLRHSLPAKSRKEAKAWRARRIESANMTGYGGVYFLFPNTLITTTPYSLSISRLKPTSAGTCNMTVRHFGRKGDAKDQRKHIPGYDKSSDIIRSELWTKPALESGDFQTEDIWICEKVQKGLTSPSYEAGPLSSGSGAEDPISWFHDSLLSRIDK